MKNQSNTALASDGPETVVKSALLRIDRMRIPIRCIAVGKFIARFGRRAMV